MLVVRVEAEEVDSRGAEAFLGGVDGILVPGGFGMRGIEGKIEAIRYARTRNDPVSSASAWACNAPSSSSPGTCSASRTPTAPSSIQTTDHPVIWLMEEQQSVRERGGTMRLGSWPCVLAPGSLAHRGLSPRSDPRAAPAPLRAQ